jgi:hypothetical protein
MGAMESHNNHEQRQLQFVRQNVWTPDDFGKNSEVRSGQRPARQSFTKGNEGKEGLFSRSSVKNFFEDRSTERNEDSEGFQNQDYDLCFLRCLL